MTQKALTEAYRKQGGALSEAALEQAAGVAWGYLCQQTMGRILTCGPDADAAVTGCFSELVEILHSCGDHGRLTRETVGDWSRSYDSGPSAEERCRAAIRRHLGETGLLYRGWPR